MTCHCSGKGNCASVSCWKNMMCATIVYKNRSAIWLYLQWLDHWQLHLIVRRMRMCIARCTWYTPKHWRYIYWTRCNWCQSHQLYIHHHDFIIDHIYIYIYAYIYIRICKYIIYIYYNIYIYNMYTYIHHITGLRRYLLFVSSQRLANKFRQQL